MDDTRSMTGTGPALRARRLYADRRMAESLRSRGWLVLEPAQLVSLTVFTDAVGAQHINARGIDVCGDMKLPSSATERRP